MDLVSARVRPEVRQRAGELLDVLVLAVFLLLPLQHPRLHARLTVGDLVLVVAALVALVAPPPPTSLRALLLPRRTFVAGMVLLVVGGVLGLAFAGELGLSAGLLARLLGTVVICGWLVWRWAPDPEHARAALGAMVLAAAASAVLGVVGVVGDVTRFELQSAAGRAQGLAGNANLFGAVSAVALAVGATLALGADRPRRRWMWLLAVAAIAGGIAWSASRSAVVGVIVGLAPMVVHLGRRAPARAALVAGALAVVLVVGLTGVVRIPVVDRALERTDTPASEGGRRSREARFDYLSRGIEERETSSLVLGSGLRDGAPSLHSGVAEVWVGLGLLGLVGWLLVVGDLVKPALRLAVRSGPMPDVEVALVAASTGFLAYLGCALLVDNVWNRYIWLLGALVLVLQHAEPRRRSSPG
jgi:hypothetical protein